MDPEHQYVAPGSHPQLLTNTGDHAIEIGAEPDAAAGAIWRLEPPERDLDANIIALPPAGAIQRHVGPALDVLLHVLSGTGELITAHARITLSPGALVWLPRGSEREFRASAEGLRYLTVHQRRHDALSITTGPPSL